MNPHTSTSSPLYHRQVCHCVINSLWECACASTRTLEWFNKSLECLFPCFPAGLSRWERHLRRDTRTAAVSSQTEQNLLPMWYDRAETEEYFLFLNGFSFKIKNLHTACFYRHIWDETREHQIEQFRNLLTCFFNSAFSCISPFSSADSFLSSQHKGDPASELRFFLSTKSFNNFWWIIEVY